MLELGFCVIDMFLAYFTINFVKPTKVQIQFFFAAYINCKKIYSFSRVVFFCQSKIANYFHSKINDSSRLRATTLTSSRFGVRATAVPSCFAIYP